MLVFRIVSLLQNKQGRSVLPPRKRATLEGCRQNNKVRNSNEVTLHFLLTSFCTQSRRTPQFNTGNTGSNTRTHVHTHTYTHLSRGIPPARNASSMAILHTEFQCERHTALSSEFLIARCQRSTARCAEDETRNGHRNGKRNPDRSHKTIVRGLFSIEYLKRAIKR